VQFPALVGWDLDVHLPYGFAALAFGLTLLLCAAGSFLPAVRAGRLSAAEAIRNE
jgi:ABC-type lipoprotein release transport system permease subunit